MLNKKYKESGNVLFLILIAIALFGAISYAISRSGVGSANISKEQNIIYASQIVQYGSNLRTAIKRIKATDTADTDISFANNVVAGYEHATPQPEFNQVFSPNGGGAKYIPPNPEWLDSTQSAQAFYGEVYFPRKVCIQGIGSVPLALNCRMDGIDNEPLLLFIPYITKELCIELNNKLGIENPSGDPPQELSHAWSVSLQKFKGVYEESVKLDQAGQYYGCFEGDVASMPPAGTYHYFHVLLAR